MPLARDSWHPEATERRLRVRERKCHFGGVADVIEMCRSILAVGDALVVAIHWNRKNHLSMPSNSCGKNGELASRRARCILMLSRQCGALDRSLQMTRSRPNSSAVMADLDAYLSLPVGRRPMALKAIDDAIKRIFREISKLEASSSLVRSGQSIDQEPTPVIVRENQSTQTENTGFRPSPATMLDSLLALSPSEFEHAVARLLPHIGYRDVRRTGGAGDLGADIVCYDEHGGLAIVQCKRYAPGNNVTSPDIQTFFGMMVHHGARQGIYVTTSTFTQSATDLAAARDIRTIDGAQLAALIASITDVLESPEPDAARLPSYFDCFLLPGELRLLKQSERGLSTDFSRVR